MEEIYDKELEKFLTITQSESYAYKDRTIENANAADITLAFARNFETPGERLTASAAGGKLIQIPLGVGLTPEEATAKILQGLIDRGVQGDDLTFNIAGNGIQNLMSGRDGESAIAVQKHIDRFVHGVIKGMLDAGVRVKGLRSGGQTGADEAGVKAGLALCVPTHVHLPHGYRRRDEVGTDRQYYKSDIAEIFTADIEGTTCQAVRAANKAPFYLEMKYLPEALKEDRSVAFNSVSNAVEYLKVVFTERADQGLNPLTVQEKEHNMLRKDRAQDLFSEPAGGAENIHMTPKQRYAWNEIESAVIKSVYIDCLTQNGDELAQLLGTGLRPLNEERGRDLMEVRHELRGCLERQSSDGWCLVGKNVVLESGDLAERYNFIDTRGKVFSENEWFAEARTFEHGTAVVKTLDGFELSLHRTDSDKVASMIKEAREAAQTEALHSRVSFRRG